ncbi:hypothetical protein [Paenibacillus polymyxa]|uniref:hypothetical protein n=1 Tax=Paenibacillus polymyxa TaxID=1406 RepID=UPI0007EACBAA|nr:hypothetical protein [Paenibacillus polymyxa]OAZ43351.1 hypothetical protein A9Z39_22170 [Paenibacillus polymyxa]
MREKYIKARDNLMSFYKIIPKPILYIFLTAFSVYIIFTSFLLFFYNDWGRSGTLGDTFGILNALFSSAGTAGVIYTLYLQNKTFEVSIKPLLELVPQGEENDSFKVAVTNIGNGTAINIEVEPARIQFSRNKHVIFKEVKKDIFNLRSGSSHTIYIKPFNDLEKETPSILLKLLDDRYSNMVIKFSVKYQDVDFKEFKQTFELGLSDRRIRMTLH